MASETLELLKDMFPGRVALNSEEVARALHGADPATGRAGRGRVNRVRESLQAGVIIPGIRRDGGRWRIPIVAFAAHMDGLTNAKARSDAPTAVYGSAGAGTKGARRRTPIGPRPRLLKLARQRTGEALAAILDEVALLEAQQREASLLNAPSAVAPDKAAASNGEPPSSTGRF